VHLEPGVRGPVERFAKICEQVVSSDDRRARWDVRLDPRRGFATRRRDPEDRRRHLVEVTKKGIAVIEKVSEVMDGVEDELLDGLDPSDREQLEGLLSSIWDRSGGYEAWAQAADLDDRAA